MFIGKSECRQNLCLHQNSAGHLHGYEMGLSEIHLCCRNEFQLSGLDTDAVDKERHVKANRTEVAVSTFAAMMGKKNRMASHPTHVLTSMMWCHPHHVTVVCYEVPQAFYSNNYLMLLFGKT